MQKLILCLGKETFTLNVTQIDKNEESQWRYWNYSLDVDSKETIRLVRHLGYCRFEPVWFRYIEICKTEEDVKGFFGNKVVTNYWFKTRFHEDRLYVKSMQLEE